MNGTISRLSTELRGISEEIRNKYPVIELQPSPADIVFDIAVDVFVPRSVGIARLLSLFRRHSS